MKLKSLLIVSGLSVALASAAFGQSQPQPGRSYNLPPPQPSTLHSPIGGGPNQYAYRFSRDWSGEPQSYRDALRFASCVARYDRGLVQSAAVSDASKPAGRGVLQEISRRNRGCAATPGVMSATVLRAAFFETAYKRGYLQASSAPLGMFTEQDRELAVSRCQLQTAPLAVKTVLSAEPESAAETAAIAQLLSQTKQCGAVVVEKDGALIWRLALLEAAARG